MSTQPQIQSPERKRRGTPATPPSQSPELGLPHSDGDQRRGTPATPENGPLPGGRGSDVPHVAAPLVLNPLEMIEFQRGQIRRKEYIPLGRLERIDLGEGCLPNTAPDNPLVGRWTADGHPIAPALDFLNQGPMVALSQDEQDILVCTHMVHPPPLLDPNWKRKAQVEPLEYVGQIPILEKPAMIEQSLLHRCWVGPQARWIKKGGKWVPDGEWFLPGKDGEEWMVFQPVSQLLIFLVNGGWGIINCRSDFHGRHTVLCYDRKHEEGHILFGRKTLGLHTEVLRSV